MQKLFVVLLVVAVAGQAFGRVFRHKRQSDGDEDNLDDRYGSENRRPWQNQNQFPWQNQNGQSPWQNQNQNGGGQFPWQNQNQNGGQGQFPWQNQQNGGQGQFPGQNQNQNGGQGQFPWQNQNQNSGQGQFPGQNQNQNGGQGQFPWQNQNQNGGQGQFPGQNQNQNGGQGQFPGQNQNQFPRPTTTSTTQAPNGNAGGTSSQECLRSCPVTSEYNPVCGSDNVTYTNPGRLTCAQACGVSVSLQRSSPCPTTTVAPTS